jgi:serine-type D-Ala-D-Ala carboxypeptidase (penicillin-binding protein 5/6)
MDAGTGHILYQKEPDLRLPPASTSKIVTALVALESQKNPKQLLAVTRKATQVPASKIYLRSGQLMTMKDLLYSVLLSSANDASLVLAEGVAGSVKRFAEMMTKKVRDIGAANSHFTNPHGLTAPDHYSTARDLATIFRYAMNNPTFREIVQTKSSRVKSISTGKKKSVRQISVRNHNRLLWNFDGAIGGKTGYTRAAQKCFVGAVSRNGVTLIVSILGSRNLWGDTTKLLEHGFDNYHLLEASAPSVQHSSLEVSMVTRAEPASALLLAEDGGDNFETPDGYIVQVASFRERDRAESLEKQISERGFEVFLEKAPFYNDETTYRVRVGPYPDLLEAQEVALEIENRSGFKAIIFPASPSADSGLNPN